MKFKSKDITIWFLILVFIIEGMTFFRLNKLEKVAEQLIDANHTLYQIYKLDRELNKLTDAIGRDAAPTSELYPTYPLKRPLKAD